MPILVRVTSFKWFTLLGFPTWGVGYPPHVTTKLKRDENFAGLIWASKVYYSKGLKDVWDKQNGIKSSSKKEHEKDII